MSLSLMLDDILFDSLEIPERFGPLGGEQAMAVHEFPGGTRTIQTMGAFPKTVAWSGYLTGSTASDRQQQLDRKRTTGKSIILRYGRWAWQGVVREFEAEPGHEYLIPYRIAFEPSRDLSGVATNAQGQTSVEATFQKQQTALNSTTDPNTQVQPLPAGMTGAVATMQSDTQSAINDGNGIVADIPPADQAQMAADTAAVKNAAAPYIQGTDAAAASSALDASNYATGINNTIFSINQPQAQVEAINPNIYSVAQQYLGDSSRWKEITDASGLPPDPQPIGAFTLKIPPK